jgi:hypothetical protein
MREKERWNINLMRLPEKCLELVCVFREASKQNKLKIRKY